MAKTFQPIKLQKSDFTLLKELTEAVAVSGDESAVRKIIRKQLEGLADEVRVDALGSVIAVKHAKTKPFMRVLLDAHMDEVGFLLTNGSDGIFSFRTVGGVDGRQLAGKSVWVGKDRVPGVIGAKAIHLLTREERNRAIQASSLKIDVGEENKGKVKPGDRASFATKFMHNGPSIIAKAIDDRIGCAILLKLLANVPDHIELTTAFTVQEEVGLRGARSAAYGINPDLAIAIDSTPAGDLPRHDLVESNRYNTKLGFGPALYTSDSSTLSDPRLIRHLVKVGDKYKIPYQFRQPGGGGTNAGSIHLQRGGIPAVSVSVPGRYAHSAAMISRVKDWEDTVNLVHAFLLDLTPDLLKADR